MVDSPRSSLAMATSVWDPAEKVVETVKGAFESVEIMVLSTRKSTEAIALSSMAAAVIVTVFVVKNVAPFVGEVRATVGG